MEKRTKERLVMIAGLIVLSGLNGAAGARVLHRMLKKHMREQARIKDRDAISEESFRVMLSRLKAQGIMENDTKGLWHMTKKGLGIVRHAEIKEKEYDRARERSRLKKDTIIIFDVPEHKRTLRGYLRIELISLGYKQLQKSVWIGGGPLPGAFMDFIKEAKLADTVHIFTIAKRGTVAE